MEKARKKINIVSLIVNFLCMIVLGVGLIVGNVVAFQNEGAIDAVLTPAKVDNESLEVSSANGQAMSRRIMEEGSVLLKNNGTLPLSGDVSKVNVFGWASIDWLYGSGGSPASGQVTPETGNGPEHFAKNIDLYDALDEAGILYNTRLYDMYHEYYKPIYIGEKHRNDKLGEAEMLKEPKITDKKYYSDDLLSYSKDFSDTALVVITRFSAEGMELQRNRQVKDGPGAANDSSRHMLEISTEEEALLKYTVNNYENVVVIMQTTNSFECGFLETIKSDDGENEIDACLVVGFTGTKGAVVIPQLLYGESTPSGKLADTFAYDLYSAPANAWTNCTGYTDQAGTKYYDYVEGIYVGYKWYETADAEGLWSAENGYAKGYDSVVQFPFGFGMSYTTFDWKVDDIKLVTETQGAEGVETTKTSVDPKAATIGVTDKTKIEFTVTVTNTGDTYAGRDVVEIYVTPPYTEGGIEKSSVSLMNYAKSNVLAPGSSETITVLIDMYDAASYDCYDLNKNDFKGWELEKGDYAITLRTDSHTVKELTYKDSEQAGTFNFNVAETIKIEKDPVTGKTVKNLFTGADAVDTASIDGNSKDGSFQANIPWFTRTNFTKPADFESLRTARVKRAVTPEAAGYRWLGTSAKNNCNEWDAATTDVFGNPVDQTKPVWGVNHGLKLADNTGKLTELGEKLGEDYNAEEWKQVLEQVTVAEFRAMTDNYYGSPVMASVGKPKLVDLDGPAQIKSFVEGPRGTGYPTMVVIAQTWNPKLAYEFGKSFGDDMVSVGVTGLWGWAMDCHRTSWFGRNHESPSECAQLAGTMIANAVKGCNTRGRITYIKHFALYTASAFDNQIWLTEQALRETYLKAFRKAFVDGQSLGCMVSYSGLGAEHSETTEGMISGVLRGEWAFNGAITTDWEGEYIDQGMRNGVNFAMGAFLDWSKHGMDKQDLTYDETSTGRLQNRMKESVHQVLYSWLRADYNARTYVPEEGETFLSSNTILMWCWWKPLIYTLDAIGGIAIAGWAAIVLIGAFMPDKKERKGGQD